MLETQRLDRSIREAIEIFPDHNLRLDSFDYSIFFILIGLVLSSDMLIVKNSMFYFHYRVMPMCST